MYKFFSGIFTNLQHINSYFHSLYCTMWNFAIVMKRMSLLPFFFFCLTLARAQTGLRTLVTSGPVVAGESFQVQYVLSGAEKEDEVLPPDFRNFRRISGPDVYTAAGYGANGPLTMKNTVYTL